MYKFIVLTIFVGFGILVNSANALVTPKNYDFTYDKFREFYPDTQLSEIQKKYPQLKLINKEGSTELYEATIIHVRYKFPLYIQVKDAKVIDFYAKLPSYFIHDIFHQSLINRFGKQNKFYNKDGTSIYIWNNADNLLITYSGACTITCFPIFIHGIKPAMQKNSLLNKMDKIFKPEF
jgi:hypothetical protein